MENKFSLDTPKLEFVVESRRLFAVQFVLILLTVIVFLYIFFWHALQNDALAISCFITSLCSATLLYLVYKQKINTSTAANGGLALTTIIVYLTGVFTWQDSPAGVAFFPAIVTGAMIFWGRRKAIAWTAICTVLLSSLPWVSQLVEPMPAFNEVKTFFNVFYSASAMMVVCAVVYLAEDISVTLVRELMTMKNVLETTQVDLLKVQRYRNRFFASISHEIRTPMNAVRGISEILSHNRNLSAEEAELVTNLHRSSTHLLSIINDLLDVSKLEEDKLRFVETDFDLRDVIYDAKTIVRYAAVEKNLDLKSTIDQALPKLIRADANRLRQILVNLLGNAVKFTPAGYVALRCTLAHHAGTQQDSLHIEVEDSGIGIPLSAQKDIFDGYMQGSDSVSQNFGGTGLGLNICKRIVEMQGGDIRFVSTEGQGTTFVVTFPFKPVDNQHAQTAQQIEVARHIDSPYTVMIVDDNKINLLVAQKQLAMRMPNSQFITADNGKIALDMLASGLRPDIILMDIHMPVLGGIEATRLLRANSASDIANVPIIAMTANTADEDVRLCYDAGMNEFISKPFDVDALLIKMLLLCPPQ